MADPMFPFTGYPFPVEEYRARLARVIDAFDAYGVDAIAATVDTSQEYLAGFGNADSIRPFLIIVAPGREPVYVVRHYDEVKVRTHTWVSEFATYLQSPDYPRVVADVLRRLGLERARLGMELGAWGLAPRDVSDLTAVLPDLRIVDTTRLIPAVSAVKTELELGAMRDSMVYTEAAVAAFYEAVRPGVSELEVGAAMSAAAEAAGGTIPFNTILLGQRTALPHGDASPHRISAGEPAYTEVGGDVKHYQAGLCRTAILGRNPDAEAMHRLTEEALAAGIDAIRPGATAGEVDAACRAVFRTAGVEGKFRHRTGYATGIAWLVRGYISLEPDATDVIKAGMTFHLPVHLFEHGRFGVGTSQSVVATETGVEIISRTSPELRLL